MTPPLKQNMDLANLLQKLSNALSDREGNGSILNEDYSKGVEKAIPEIEKKKELKIKLIREIYLEIKNKK